MTRGFQNFCENLHLKSYGEKKQKNKAFAVCVQRLLFEHPPCGATVAFFDYIDIAMD
jgi:hypothetical protein